MGLLNVDKDDKGGVSAKKKEEGTVDTSKNKPAKVADDIKNREELLPELQQELQQKGNTAGVLTLSAACFCDLIHYLFRQKVINLSKMKRDDCMEILSPLLEQHYVSESIALVKMMHKMTEQMEPTLMDHSFENYFVSLRCN